MNRLKVKEWEKTYHANTNQSKENWTAFVNIKVAFTAKT